MAEGKCFHLEVVTPDRQFYIGDADSLVLPAIDGYMGVEAGHEPVVTAVVPGELKYRSEGAWTHAVVSQGLAEIMPDRVMVLTTSAERPEEIDWKRAEAAKERAEERLRQKLSIQEYYNQGRAGPGHGPAEGGEKIDAAAPEADASGAVSFVTEARPAPP